VLGAAGCPADALSDHRNRPDAPNTRVRFQPHRASNANTNYQVRLVGTNTRKRPPLLLPRRLRSRTSRQPAPAVHDRRSRFDQPTTSARRDQRDVNPQGDATTWRLQTTPTRLRHGLYEAKRPMLWASEWTSRSRSSTDELYGPLADRPLRRSDHRATRAGSTILGGSKCSLQPIRMTQRKVFHRVRTQPRLDTSVRLIRFRLIRRRNAGLPPLSPFE
jgi:hypothetical protein